MFMQNIVKLSWVQRFISTVIVYANFLALSRNGKESENQVLWPWPLTYNLKIFWFSSGCQGTRSCKISLSCVQRAVHELLWSQRKNSDENNTVRRYRADNKHVHSSSCEPIRELYGASPAIRDHTVLPATRHRWTRPALTMQPGRPVLDFPVP